MAQPALLGGLFIGVLSALPLVNVGNCCCLWVVPAARCAAYLHAAEPAGARSAPATARSSGCWPASSARVVWLVVSIPLSSMMAPLQRQMSSAAATTPDMPPEMRARAREHAAAAGIVFGLLFGFIVMLLSEPMFAMLGGLLGVAIFRKKSPPAFRAPIPPARSLTRRRL